LATPLACGACTALLELEGAPSPFEVLGVERAFVLDPGALRRRLLELARLVHPDYFATADAATRARAERASALLHQAFETLSDEVARADWLIADLGGPREGELRDMPKPFLLEVLEWNEALEEARAEGATEAARARLQALGSQLGAARSEALERLRARLTPLPARGAEALREARRELNALRYLERALEQIEALRLEQATAR
jgi:molecular chaperone HscB